MATPPGKNHPPPRLPGSYKPVRALHSTEATSYKCPTEHSLNKGKKPSDTECTARDESFVGELRQGCFDTPRTSSKLRSSLFLVRTFRSSGTFVIFTPFDYFTRGLRQAYGLNLRMRSVAFVGSNTVGPFLGYLARNLRFARL